MEANFGFSADAKSPFGLASWQRGRFPVPRQDKDIEAVMGCDVDSVRSRMMHDIKRGPIGIDEDNNIFVFYCIEGHSYVRCWVDLLDFLTVFKISRASCADTG